MTERNTRLFTIVLIALVVVGSGTAMAFTSAASDRGGALDAQETTTETQQQPAVTIRNQSGDGSSVTVESATLPNGGFIAIYGEGGYVGGRILGISDYIQAGTQRNVVVDLNRTLSSDTTVTAVLHTDSNDNQQIDYDPNDPSTDLAYLVDDEEVSDTALVTVEGQQATTQAGTTQVATTEATTGVGTTQAATTQATTEVGVTETTAAATEVGTTQGGTTQAATTRVATTGATEVGVTETTAGTTQAATTQATTGVGVTETTAAATQAATTQAGTTQAATTQVGTTQAATTQVATTQAATTQAATTQAARQPGQVASIAFNDQIADGRTITIESVTLPNGGFVVIHDSRILQGRGPSIQKARGRIRQSVVVASRYLGPGTHRNVEIELTQSQVEELRRGLGNQGQTQLVVAAAYRDTNGNRQFDFVDSQGRQDRPYVGPDGDFVFSAVLIEFPDDQSAMVAPRFAPSGR